MKEAQVIRPTTQQSLSQTRHSKECPSQQGEAESRGVCTASRLPPDVSCREGRRDARAGETEWACFKQTLVNLCDRTGVTTSETPLRPVTVLRVACNWHLDTVGAVTPWEGPHLCAFLTENVNFNLTKRPHHKPKGETFHYITDWSSSRSQRGGERDPTS